MARIKRGSEADQVTREIKGNDQSHRSPVLAGGRSRGNLSGKKRAASETRFRQKKARIHPKHSKINGAWCIFEQKKSLAEERVIDRRRERGHAR